MIIKNLVTVFSIFLIQFSYINLYALDAQSNTDIIGVNENLLELEGSIDFSVLDQTIVKESKNFAKKYVDNLASFDQEWKGQSPSIIGKGFPYYTDDINTPIGYEWKVKCNNYFDCGSVIIGFVGGKTTLLQASTSGKTNYEVLLSNKRSYINRLYYFSPVDIFLESTDGNIKVVKSMNPNNNNIISSDDLAKVKDEFSKIRINLNNLKINPNEVVGVALTDAGTVPGSVMPCGKILPCYSQNPYVTVSPRCSTGCVPTAMAIIFGYYDRNSYKSNLLSGIASDSLMDQGMANSIRTYMYTRCASGEGYGLPGSTGFTTMANGIQYAKDRGYVNSTAVLEGGSNLGPSIRTEIKAGRPVMINIQSSISNGHTMAGYAYTQNGLIVDSVKVNVGWGSSQPDIYMPITGALTSGPSQLIGMKLINILKVSVF